MLMILQTGYLDIWEPATLAIKRDAYSIKCSGSSGVVVTEKFTRTTAVWFKLQFLRLSNNMNYCFQYHGHFCVSEAHLRQFVHISASLDEYISSARLFT